MSETLVNLSLLIDRINFHEEFSAKCLELGQMKKLKKIKIWWLEPYDEMTEAIEAKDMLRKKCVPFSFRNSVSEIVTTNSVQQTC